MIMKTKAASLAGLSGLVVSKSVELENYRTTLSASTEIDVREYAARVVSQRLGINMPVARLVSLHAGLAVRA